MEFSFFVILLTFFSIIVFLIQKKMFEIRLRLLFPILLSVLFLALSESNNVRFILFGFMAYFITVIGFTFAGSFSFQKRTYIWSLLVVSLIMMLVEIPYFFHIDLFWNEIDHFFVSVLESFRLLNGYQFIDVFYIFRFFRFYYPSILFFIIFISWINFITKNHYPISFWYRFFKKFDHKSVIPLIGIILVYALSYLFRQSFGIRQGLLNLLVYFALPYVFYGYLCLSYGLYRIKALRQISFILVFCLLVFSGPLFIFTGIMFLGIGISDIWMSYDKIFWRKLFSKKI